jgi:Spy/CpxP family protein refolding chaperone
MGLGLALSLGAVAVASAQSTQPEARQGAGQRQRGEWGPGRRGGFDKALLKGITLSADQQKRVDALRQDERSRMQADREQFGKVMADARQARERGDTAAAKAKMQEVRKHTEQLRDQRIASLRAILTSDQQKQFDSNLAAFKAHAKNRQAKGGFRRGQGERGQGNRQSTR